MRPVKRSDKFDTRGKPVEYTPWSSAKGDLINELGDFCSFCGKQVNRSALAIEHILAKKTYGQYQYHWNNFLLACVNCNSVKGTKDINTLRPFLPHKDNLLCYIDIGIGGSLALKLGLSTQESISTNAFINLVGLDRRPGHPKYSEKDDRWEYRMTAYELAQRQLIKYQAQKIDLDTIIHLALSRGFFSVWFKVFQAQHEVIKALIDAFKGTNKKKFDSSYSPIP